MQRYNKIVNQANKTKKDILDDTMFMICNQRDRSVPLIVTLIDLIQALERIYCL
jgi:hypothetical protein